MTWSFVLCLLFSCYMFILLLLYKVFFYPNETSLK